MSRNQWIRIGMIVCTVIVVIAAAVSLSGIFGGSPFSYANAEKYTAGETEISGNVRNLEIVWVNGKVNLEYHSEQRIDLRETSRQAIGDDMKLRWWLDGDTLRVQYAKSGFRLGWNQEKELTVILPKDISFGTVNISATSGDLNLPGLKAETVNLNVTSGDIQAEAEAKKATANATSGDLALHLAGDAEEITAGTTSGSVRVEAGNAGKIKATSTSGKVAVTAGQVGNCEAGATSGAVSVALSEADRVEIGTTSGDVTVRLAKFSELKVGSTSGKITAELPEQPGFTAEIGSVSGKIDYNLPLSRNGDRYVCGDGSAKVEMSSTSGNIQLNRAE